MLRSVIQIARSCHCPSQNILNRLISTETQDVFAQLLQQPAMNIERSAYYTSLVSSSTNSLVEGYFETMDKETDNLLVVSNGFDGDEIMKKANRYGVRAEWSFYPMIHPTDADEVAQDIITKERITHCIMVHVDSFTGSVIPLRQILSKVRKVRKDVSLCVDNSAGFILNPMPQIDDVIDFSIHSTHVCSVQPEFVFMLCHLPAILSEKECHSDHFLSSLYTDQFHLEHMKPAVQEAYVHSLDSSSLNTIRYKYEDTKAQLVSRLKFSLPLIPQGMDQSSFCSCFLVPQEYVHLRELLSGLEDLRLPVDHRFLSSGMPAISIKTEDVIRYVENGGMIEDIVKRVEQMTKRFSGVYRLPADFRKQEEKYRRKSIFGEKNRIEMK